VIAHARGGRRIWRAAETSHRRWLGAGHFVALAALLVRAHPKGGGSARKRLLTFTESAARQGLGDSWRSKFVPYLGLQRAGIGGNCEQCLYPRFLTFVEMENGRCLMT
jgi:hypothetical protein